MKKNLKDKKSLKIAIIGHKRIPSNEGGIEKGVEEHAVRMTALGHDVTVYNRGSDNINGKEFNQEKLKEYKGVKIVTVPTPNGGMGVVVYSFLATIHAIFRHYDVISYRASGPCVMIPLAKFFGQRCVASIHGFDSQRDKWGKLARFILRKGEKYAAKRADACLVLSSSMKKYVRDTYGKEALRFANGITVQKKLPASEITERWGLEKDNYILSLGRVEPEKGLHYLIEAFRNCTTDKKLVIAGGDSNHEYYRKLTDMAKGDDRILFIGQVGGTTTAELYSNAYVFTLPSNLEGMANTLLESMSYGCCDLVSDIPENTEVVGDHAVVFHKGNVTELQEKLQLLLDSPETVDGYREKAADFITSKYNWDIIVEQMLRIYRGEKVEYETVWEEHQRSGKPTGNEKRT